MDQPTNPPPTAQCGLGWARSQEAPPPTPHRPPHLNPTPTPPLSHPYPASSLGLAPPTGGRAHIPNHRQPPTVHVRSSTSPSESTSRSSTSCRGRGYQFVFIEGARRLRCEPDIKQGLKLKIGNK